LVLERFSAFLRGESGAVEEFECEFIRKSHPQVLARHETRLAQCRARAAADPQRQGQMFRPAGSPDFAPTVQEQAYDAHRLLLFLAPIGAEAVSGFQRAHAPCGLQRVCSPNAASTVASQPAAALAATASSASERSRGGSGRLYNQIKGLLVLVALFPAYALVAYRKGTRVATRTFTALSFAGGLALMGSLFIQPWADLGTLGSGLAMAAVGVAGFTLAGYVLSRAMASVFDALFANRVATPPGTQRKTGSANALR
jgi:hypothetical protein